MTSNIYEQNKKNPVTICYDNKLPLLENGRIFILQKHDTQHSKNNTGNFCNCI